MHVMARPSRKKSWQTGRERVSVLADLAIRKETVVRKLTELREAHDLTQERAAAKVGVTVRQWQRWESGASVPYARNISAIAGRFGINEGEFFEPGTEPERESSNGNDASQLDRIEQTLTEATSERQAMLELIAQQNELLQRQSSILDGIEELLATQQAAARRLEEMTQAAVDAMPTPARRASRKAPSGTSTSS